MSRRYDGRERREQTTDNYARRAEYAPEPNTPAQDTEDPPAAGGNGHMKALIAALAVAGTLATGYVTLANKPTVQAETSSSGMWRKLGEIDAQVKTLAAVADAQQKATQRELQEIRDRLKGLEVEAKDGNRKLDQLLYESNRRRQTGSTTYRPPAIAQPPSSSFTPYHAGQQ